MPCSGFRGEGGGGGGAGDDDEEGALRLLYSSSCFSKSMSFIFGLAVPFCTVNNDEFLPLSMSPSDRSVRGQRKLRNPVLNRR